MKTALVILAAGIGARYGGGIKQLEPVGPMGEIIMDYPFTMQLRRGLTRSYSSSAGTSRRTSAR